MMTLIIFTDKDTLSIDRPNVVAVYKDKLIIGTESQYHVYICSKNFRQRCFRKSFKIKGQYPKPRGIATNGEHIFIADANNSTINKYQMDGKFVKSKEHFEGSCGITIYDGKLYVAHQNKHKVQVLDLDLTLPPKTIPFGDLKEPRDVAVASNGTIYVSDYGNGCIKVFRRSGKIEKFGSDNSMMKHPRGICIYKKENNGEYVLVAAEYCVFVYTFSGKLVESIGNEKIGKMNALYGIDVDSDGNVYVADYGGRVVKKFKLEDYVTFNSLC